jgi:hypothetical protein
MPARRLDIPAAHTAPTDGVYRWFTYAWPWRFS